MSRSCFVDRRICLCFDFVFVLDKKGENIVFIVLIDKKEGERFLPLILFIVLVFTPLLMIDKKGEKDFEFICMLMSLHIL